MRILCTTTPGTGHVHPMMPLALELRTRGHEVRWVTNSPGLERVRQLGFEATAGGLSLQERNQRVVDLRLDLSAVPPRDVRPMVFGTLFATIAAAEMLPAIVAAVDGFRPHLVLHDLCELAAAPVARARGIPHVTVGFSGEPYTALLAPAAEAMSRIWASFGLDVPDHAGVFDHSYLHPWPADFGARPARDEVVDSAHMGYDGRTHADVHPEWLSEMGVDRPLVYVSFGTEVGPLAPWPSVLEALASLDVDALITTGHGLSLAAHGVVPSNVRVETYVPQSLVLERAAVMVAHAGAGAISATIASGVPQVCVPMVADQWDNADAAVAAGVGMVLERDQRSAAAVAAAVATLTTDDSTRRRTLAWRDRASAMPSVSTVVDSLLAAAGGSRA